MMMTPSPSVEEEGIMSRKQKQARAANAHARACNHALVYAHVRTYVSLAAKGSGLLALLLSTVVLLGGYVQSLDKTDFFCIVAITVIQAAGIFQDWETNAQYFLDFWETFLIAGGFLIAHIPPLALVLLPLVVLIMCVLLFYLVGPLACAAISSWRIAKLNHHVNNKDTNMMAALNIFYSLIIFQGTMCLVLLLPMNMYEAMVARRLLALLEQLSSSEKWGEKAIYGYILHVFQKCRKDPLSIKGIDLIKYGAELLDSESSQDDYLYGARLLSAFVNRGEDVSLVLLPSRHRIQRLIDSLVISSSSRLDEACVQLKSQSRSGRCYAVIGGLDDKKEIRELAATIVADVAAHIDDLSNYPGAMRCISSLLQHQEETTTRTYRNRDSKQVPDDQSLPFRKKWHMKLMTDQGRMEEREHRHRNRREGGTSIELVQQGLTILERLASNSDENRRIICGAPGLLPKITAPVHSATLIQDVKTNKAWADIVTRCLKVLYQLIRAPDGVNSHEIFSNNVQALSNLKSILLLDLGNNDEAGHQELQLVAMEILTELALDDLSINLTQETRKVLVTKQLQLFLHANGDEEEESAATAGRAMVSLSTNSGSNSALMTTENYITGRRLTDVLDDKNSITRRTIAAQIMANLCAHCNVNNMKELLTKVLGEIMSIKIKTQQIKASTDLKNPASSGDEENQGNSASTENTEERNDISTGGDDTETEEVSDHEREEQEAFLSLAQVICGKLNCADLDVAIQNAVQNENNNAGTEEQRREAFVEKLKAIIDGNCHPTADCLRIVKLCGQISKSVMRCEQYLEIFRNKGFKNSLSEASETMSELESCMLFVGTDFGLRKTVRPLFSEIEKTWSEGRVQRRSKSLPENLFYSSSKRENEEIERARGAKR